MRSSTTGRRARTSASGRPAGSAPARALRTAVAALVAASGLLLHTAPEAAAEVLSETGFSVRSEPLPPTTPLEVTHAPDGRRFVAEKTGRVRTVLPNGQVSVLLDVRNRVNSFSDRGMLGLAVDKDFATNGWLYLLFSQELNPATPDGDGPMTSALTRVTVRADSTVAEPGSPGVYILGADGQTPCPTPTDTQACMPSDHYWHSIGTVRSDPADGTLWVGSGDAHVPGIDATSYRGFDPTNTAGKILHVDKDGRGLPGHPFCPEVTDLTRTCTKVYAEGFRNPFRFTLRPGKGPVVGDVGFGGYEEVDLVRPGGNYGWPCYEGPVRYQLHESSATCRALYAQEGTPTAAVAPAWSYPHGAGAAVIAGPVYRGTSYPEHMVGDVFVADYVQGWVKRLEVDAEDRVTDVHPFASGWAGVSLYEAPDGDLGYVNMGVATGSQASLTEYGYSGPTNAPPTAAASADGSAGPAPLTVRFSSAGSIDPEGGALTYLWDFGDGSVRSTAADPEHVYDAQGSYTARLTVRDPQGAQAVATVAVSVGSNSAPTVSIDAPGADLQYSGGVPVDLAGSATDAEDGPLAGAALTWDVLVRHNTHLHLLTTASGPTSSFVPLTDHDADAEYEIRLTATDSQGARTTVVRTIRPRLVQLTLASSPAGVPVSYDGDTGPAPQVHTSAVGFQVTLEAPTTTVVGGVPHRFTGWSDGGAARHLVSIPTSSTTLTATYAPEPAAPVTRTAVVTAAADVTVRQDQPTSALGGSTNLKVDTQAIDGNTTSRASTYLRFGVPALASGETVTAAGLRLNVTNGTTNGPAVWRTATTWNEATTSWNTGQPARSGTTAVGNAGALGTGTVTIPLSGVTSGGDVSLQLYAESSDGLDLTSRELATAADRPQLVLTITTGGADTVDPTVTGRTPAPGATGVAVGGTVDATFSEAVQGVDPATFTLRPGTATSGAGLSATVTRDGTTDRWVLDPATDLAAGTQYTATLTGGATAIRDAAGRPLATTSWSFTTQAATRTAVLTAVADATVRQDQPTSALGRSTNLKIDTQAVDGNATSRASTYLRFTVPALASGERITGASLRLEVTNGTTNGPAVWRTATAWNEATVTWNQGQPARSGTAAIGNAGALGTGPVSVPLTGVTTAGDLSLQLYAESSDGLDLYAREYGTAANRPQLVLTVARG